MKIQLGWHCYVGKILLTKKKKEEEKGWEGGGEEGEEEKEAGGRGMGRGGRGSYSNCILELC